ncbi:MAG: nuclear transport factor 2 family protein [Bacteroidia bacterium]|nr:nuclear transport factor 2 family protein [Bacteroidia bacterium]
MKNLLFFLAFGFSMMCFGQTNTPNTLDKKNIEEMKQYFYEIDDAFNRAMVTKDSIFFVTHFAESYINCTPLGEVNSKADEIATLLKLPLQLVERTALQYDIFKYSDKIATMSVTKKLTRKDATISYVRRTIIYELIDGKWLIVSGQGTSVLAKYIDRP